ncbi:MAG: alpha-glucan family phosphorylase [Clostridia bacterium]|nr:alpha-glucan family phosphorylase [Clostridia bacterium]
MEEIKHPTVAYFCMEYAIDPSVRSYAGGLGILAGDYLKGANDCSRPIIGIGINWKQGYTDQYLDHDTGMPYDSYRNSRPDFLEDTGLTVDLEICARNVVCKILKCRAPGISRLYLLDTDLPENDGAARWITGQLYGWFGEERVAQEMVLGIGGVRALHKLGIAAEVYHFNEGHAFFAGLELIREKMCCGAGFEQAAAQTRRQIVFTTHTPVVEGNESHPIRRLMYMGANNGLNEGQLEALGGEPFNMTAAALRLSRRANAVSQLHAQTAQKMWAGLDGRCAIIGITNAIHLPTWADVRIHESVARHGGPQELLRLHQENKKAMIDFVGARTGIRLREEILTIGFSRRAVGYKRSNLIFADEAFITPLLQGGKLQIVFSGKAHPLDDSGKEIIRDIVARTRLYPQSVVFLENYDMEIGRMLTRGCDVWLNNPRRPKEASGTSGMKAAVNGVLNFSVLDGWWPEMCRDGVNGWQFGDGFESSDESLQDRHDLDALKCKLVGDLLPAYYDDRAKWAALMESSVSDAWAQFGMRRMLDEYDALLYKE